MARQFDREASPHVDAHRLVAFHVACKAVSTLGWGWDSKRSMWNTEASILQMVGGRTVRAGLSQQEVIAAPTSGIPRAIATAGSNKENDCVPYRATRLRVAETINLMAKHRHIG